MTRTTFIAAVATAALATAACGEDGGPRTAPAAKPVTVRAEAARYCALSRELDAAGSAFFAELEQDQDATPKDYERAERAFVERHAPTFKGLQAAAPATIEEDVATLLAAQRERAGLAAGRTAQTDAAAAEERVKAFEARTCR